MEERIIYISPSVQEQNIGVENYGSEEFRMNQIADDLQAKLENSGRYLVFRNNPRMSLSEIIAESNSTMPDIHVAIHSNAGGKRGPEVYVSGQDLNSKRLAQNIYDELLRIYPNPKLGRGVKIDPQLRETREVIAPSVLIEVGFHDNKEDAKWIINNISKISDAILKGIDTYFVEE
ncbi:MAG: N-acetylmuramoyl-L-alanine amidase [Clostridia bacterium]|nr:N-acetylmuramoyl-L-alanine amidase [Clostridia bacterium]